MPPILKILVIPHKLAVYRMAGCIFPSLLGGVQRTISLQPAIWAGTASIRMVENRGAVPPGIYSPTFWIGLFSCQHCTPSEVSTEIRGVFWAVWNFSIFAF